MKQCARDAYGAKGCLQRSGSLIEVSAKSVRLAARAEHLDDGVFFGQRAGRQIAGPLERVPAITSSNCTDFLKLALVVGVLEARYMLIFVEYHPGDALGLGQDRDTHSGDVGELVSEAASLDIDEKTSFDHERMWNDDLLGLSERTETLISRHFADCSAECLSPKNSIATVAFVAKITRTRHVGNMAGEHLAITAVSARREDQVIAAEVLDDSTRPLNSHSENAIFIICVDRSHLGLGHHFNPRSRAGIEKQGL